MNEENQNLKIIRVPKDILLNGNQFSWWETWLHFLFYKRWFNTDCVSWKSPTTLAPSNAAKIIQLILYLWALHQNVIISWNIKETFPIFIFCQVRGLGLYFNSAFKMRSRENALFPLRGSEFGWLVGWTENSDISAPRITDWFQLPGYQWRQTILGMPRQDENPKHWFKEPENPISGRFNAYIFLICKTFLHIL